jgi:hypothetical protein
LALLFRPFGFITGEPNYRSNKTKGPKQESQIMGAIKPKGLNRRAKFWEE